MLANSHEPYHFCRGQFFQFPCYLRFLHRKGIWIVQVNVILPKYKWLPNDMIPPKIVQASYTMLHMSYHWWPLFAPSHGVWFVRLWHASWCFIKRAVKPWWSRTHGVGNWTWHRTFERTLTDLWLHWRLTARMAPWRLTLALLVVADGKGGYSGATWCFRVLTLFPTTFLLQIDNWCWWSYLVSRETSNAFRFSVDFLIFLCYWLKCLWLLIVNDCYNIIPLHNFGIVSLHYEVQTVGKLRQLWQI